ncbi:hypothetical protein C8F04DRAFT_1228630 [Mycena alexandri]|uniref:Uncharacterized protein n=1 Tax=Mycena alexandri TaxID=1745969 RepID=A0AAD6SLQ6_9AGAR|nr:hypothetical protein C8F04DRAFT_1237210 [Mycena alexandri]KAJ7044217.1 hypothetical protein C8F04DRAFT_1228630 [Mycena alexandri]
MQCGGNKWNPDIVEAKNFGEVVQTPPDHVITVSAMIARAGPSRPLQDATSQVLTRSRRSQTFSALKVSGALTQRDSAHPGVARARHEPPSPHDSPRAPQTSTGPYTSSEANPASFPSSFRIPYPPRPTRHNLGLNATHATVELGLKCEDRLRLRPPATSPKSQVCCPSRPATLFDKSSISNLLSKSPYAP